MSGRKVQKVKLPPIHVIFKFLQNRMKVQIWLYEQNNLRIEGVITGFDEYMNLVITNAEEFYTKTDVRKPVGTIMLKGECITLICELQQ